MKKKPTRNLSEQLNMLGTAIAAFLAIVLALTVLMQVDATPSGEQSEHSHEL